MANFEMGNAFHISYMMWEDFKETVLNPNKRFLDWNKMVGMDCLIGGIDYTIDHR